LRDYRIVHFATHGFAPEATPELAGLVLSLVDERGQPREGFLGLQTVFNMRLDAEMVTPSECETGLGREVRGEGLIGLTRGFMYAGARRVAASLWKVDDAPTAELMARFYRGVLLDRKPPAAALREAQLAMLGETRWKSPYLWAAFTLQGEWK
jgi:CHAT domain-containing protein